MEVSKFNEKLNRIDGNIYTIEEVVTPLEGIYEAELIHDNVNIKTLNIYTGSKLTGTKITTYSTSTPSLTPWKTVIKIFSTEPKLYITYETTGDQVEAEDINNLQDAVNLTQKELNKENTRAINRENLIEKNLDLEVERAKASEKVLTDNLANEINRAKGSEKTISDNLSSEVNRAKVKENSIESNLNNYKTSNDSEIQGLKAKDIDLENKKANLDYVNLELNKRYTKDQTFTREEVLKKIQDLIGTAPDTLDTFKEIADALGNDPNFATTIMNELSSKVDKVAGKSLSTNDYDNTEKTKLADVNAKKHEHSNKSIIDKITQGLLDAWNSAYNHISDSIRHITSSERNLWNTVSDKANKTDIPSKLSQLTNDKKFITQDDIDTSQNHIHNNKSVLDKINQETLDDINLSVDKVLKNESTPIKTDSTLTKLSDCAGGYVHNMLLKGRTLQNLLGSCKNDIFSLTTPGATNVKKLDATLLKSNTQYSFILNLGNVSNGTSTIHLSVYYKDGTHEFKIFSSVINDIANKITAKMFTFNKDIDHINLEINTGNQSNVMVNFNSLMCLEGEVKEIPPYFDGIKSVGEAEGNFNYINDLTPEGNLFNIKSTQKDKFVINDNGSEISDNSSGYFLEYINVKDDTIYVFNDNSGIQRIYFYQNDKFLSKTNVLNITHTCNFITPSMCNKIKIQYYIPSLNKEKIIIKEYQNRIFILSCGKNLVNSNDLNMIIKPNIDKSTDYISCFIPKGVDYTFGIFSEKKLFKSSDSSVFTLHLFDKNKNKLDYWSVTGGGNRYIKTPMIKDCYFVQLTCTKNTVIDTVINGIKVSIGNTVSDEEWSDYKEDKLKISTGTEPLRGFAGGVYDMVSFDKNEITRNISKTIFEGNEDWQKSSIPAEQYFIAYLREDKCKPYSELICDKFKFSDTLVSGTNKEVINFDNNSFKISILKSKLATPDIDGLKKWLQTNPTTVYYEKNNSTSERISYNNVLVCFEDGYIQLDNAITPSASLEYSTNLPSALSGVVEIQDKILDRVNILEKKKSLTWDELEGV